MSNDVCGYVCPAPSLESWMALEKYISKSKLGIQRIRSSELFNYPSEFTPDIDTFIFLIGDRPGYPNATYLTDYNEYDPDFSDIGFPCHPKDRVKMLLGAIGDIFSICKSEKICFSITDSSQVEVVKRICFSEMFDVVIADFEKYQAPPDTLYEVRRGGCI